MYSSVMIWGWPLHSHTHSYIHNGFYRAFRELGVPTRWHDDKRGVAVEPNTLFITEGQVDKHIPIRSDCYYLLHNCDFDRYRHLPPERWLTLQAWTAESIEDGLAILGSRHTRFDAQANVLYMPWATDLLPREIDANIRNLPALARQKKSGCHFTGYFIEDPWHRVRQLLKERGVEFSALGGYGLRNVSVEENQKRVQKSIIAPALQPAEQVRRGYIPCRIFKNISYGAFGVTNHALVANLFDDRIVFGDTLESAIDRALRYARERDLAQDAAVMARVRDEHTYLNRVRAIEHAFTQKALGATAR